MNKINFLIIAIVVTTLFACTNPKKSDKKLKAFTIGEFVLDSASTDTSEYIYEDSLIRDTMTTSDPSDDQFYLLVAKHQQETLNCYYYKIDSNPSGRDTMFVYISGDVQEDEPYEKDPVIIPLDVDIESLNTKKEIVLRVIKPAKKRTGSTTYQNARKDKDLDKLKNSAPLTNCSFIYDYPMPSVCDHLKMSEDLFGIELGGIDTYNFSIDEQENGDISIHVTESPEGENTGCFLIPTPPSNTDPKITLTVITNTGKKRKGTTKYSNARTPIDFLCD